MEPSEPTEPIAPTDSARHTDGLEGLEKRVNDLVTRTARRRKLLAIGGLLLGLFTAAYLGFAWWQISGKLDAPTVVAMAEQQAAPYLNQPATAWASQLQEQAPALIDQAAAAALLAPEQLSAQVLSYVDGTIEDKMPELEKGFGELIEKLVDQAAEASSAEFSKGEFDEAQATDLVDRVAVQFGDSLQGEVDKLYGRYTEVSSGMIDQLDELAGGENLTEKQTLHRELITSFFALLQKVQASPPR